MESDPNPLSQLELFPKMERIGRFLGSLTRPIIKGVDYIISDDPTRYRGASDLLDEQLLDRIDNPEEFNKQLAEYNRIFHPEPQSSPHFYE